MTIKFSKRLNIIAIFCIVSSYIQAQRVLAVQTPQYARERLWYSCNFMKYNPDLSQDSILLAEVNEGRVSKAILDEKQSREREIINIVNSSNRAFEGISQKLAKPFERLNNYKFTFNASRDTAYQYSDKSTITNYKKRPLKVYVFGSDGNCGFGELLAPPFEIINHQWAKYTMTLRGTKNWSHIVIYAAHEKSESTDELANQSYLMISQQVPISKLSSRAGRRSRDLFDPGVFKTKSYSKLSFGGILMMYEISPKSITIFNKDGEIKVSDTLRKDLDRNKTLDSILHKFRGIDFLFLVMKEKKYNKKRLNIISYLKTKYPEILAASKVMKYSTLVSKRKNKATLKDLYKMEDEVGDLLIVEKVKEFVK